MMFHAIAASLVLALSAHATPPAPASTLPSPTVTTAFAHVVSPPLASYSACALTTDLARDAAVRVVPLESEEGGTGLLYCPAVDVAGIPPARRLQPDSRTTNDSGPATRVSFDGNQRNDACVPGSLATVASDVSLAVGPNHVVQVTNFALSVFDRQGNQLIGPLDTAKVWDGIGAACGGENYVYSDAVVAYDRTADRWVVSRFAFPSAGSGTDWNQCFAVSRTSDPTGSYDLYGFTVSNQYFNDYPKLGIWPDGYYMTADPNKIYAGIGNFVFAFDRSSMLKGAAAPHAVIFFVPAPPPRGPGVPSLSHMLPADWDGQIPPPKSAHELIVQSQSQLGGFPADAVQIYEARINWTSPSGSTLVPTSLLSAEQFNPFACSSQPCVTQPGANSGALDCLCFGYMMQRLAYRNFGNREALIFNQTVAADGNTAPGHAGILWFELSRTASVWSIRQQSVWAPDSTNRWLGSIATDRAGNTLLMYDASDAQTFPSIRYAVRHPDDPAGTFEPERTVIAGSGAIPQPNYLYGDYGTVVLDPTDDCTFWMSNTYVADSTGNWQTRIASTLVDGCGSRTAAGEPTASPARISGRAGK